MLEGYSLLLGILICSLKKNIQVMWQTELGWIGSTVAQLVEHPANIGKALNQILICRCIFPFRVTFGCLTDPGKWPTYSLVLCQNLVVSIQPR